MSRTRVKPQVYEKVKDSHFVARVSTNTTDEFPKVVFLRAKVTITPSSPKKSYEDDIIAIQREFEMFARSLLDETPFYSEDYIFSVDVAEKSVGYRKNSHLRYDIFVKPSFPMTLEKNRDVLLMISDSMDERLTSLMDAHGIERRSSRK